MKRSRGNLALGVLSGWVLLAGGGCALFAKQSARAAVQSAPTPKDETALPGPNAAVSDREKNSAAKATLSEFAWLEGKWQGDWGPRTAEQVWMAPKAGEMVGLFREVESKTLVVEVYSLVETANAIELRMRHFTPSLVAWEESNSTMLNLVRLDPKTAVFENRSGGQPKRGTLIRIDADNYVSRVEIASDGENKQVTEIHYHRQK